MTAASSSSPSSVRESDDTAKAVDGAVPSIVSTNAADVDSPQRRGAVVEGDDEDSVFPIHDIRSAIIHLVILVGNLSAEYERSVPLDPTTARSQEENNAAESLSQKASPPFDDSCSLRLERSMSDILRKLVDTSMLLKMDLHVAIRAKVELNRRKYPVDLCRVSQW